MKDKKEHNLAYIDMLIEKHESVIKKLRYYKEYNLNAPEDQQLEIGELHNI